MSATRLTDRQVAVNKALGSHPHILVDSASGSENVSQVTLRDYIQQAEPPSMEKRIRIAHDLAEIMQYIHSRGIIWGGVSTRNVLISDELDIKLCNFAGSSLAGAYPNLIGDYEARYSPPEGVTPKDDPTKELFALGNAISEITEWALPYGSIRDEQVRERLRHGEYPPVSVDNPVRGIIRKIWRLEFTSAQTISRVLSMALGYSKFLLEAVGLFTVVVEHSIR